VLGEGFNRGWHASADGKDLGAPQPVDGGMNGWHVPRSGNGAVTVDLTWVPQRQIWIGLGASVLGVLVCLLLAIRRPRRGAEDVELPVPLPRPLVERDVTPIAWRRLLLAAAVVGVGTALLFHPVAAPLVVGGMLLAGRLPRARSLCALASAAAALATGAYYVLRQWHSYPLPGFGWPSGFERGHSSALAAVALLAADVALSLAARSRAARGATSPSR
jgi:arabinofuranan 3-O-arabinosyltransferase